MPSLTIESSNPYQDRAVWDHLKQAIASSSGFQRWRREQEVFEQELSPLNLDYQVRRYLRETLETLAY